MSDGQNISNGSTAAARLERLPWTSFHVKLIILLSLGEFFDLYALFAGGFAVPKQIAFYKQGLGAVVFYNIAVLFFGAFFGAVIFNYFGDRIGRRTAILVNLFVLSLGYLLTPLATNIQLLGLFRFIVGLGAGPEAILVLDVMISEFFPSAFRGKALAMGYTIGWTAPIVISLLAYFIIGVNQPIPGWQLLYVIGGLGVLLIIPLRFLIPESPRWLEIKGRNQQADAIITKIEEVAKKEKGTLKEPVALSVVRAEKVPLNELFSKTYSKRTIMLWLFQFTQTGVYYGFAALAPAVLFSEGISLVHTLQYSLIIYTSYFIASASSIFIIDNVKFDRKFQISIFALLMGIDGLAFGYTVIPVVIVLTGFIFGFVSTIFSNAFHLYGAELYPTRMRATGDGIAYSLSRLGNFVWLSILPLVLESHGSVAMFSIVFVLSLVVTFDIILLGPKASKIELETLAT